MTGNELLQIATYLAVLLALVKPLGAYMANVYDGRSTGPAKVGSTGLPASMPPLR